MKHPNNQLTRQQIKYLSKYLKCHQYNTIKPPLCTQQYRSKANVYTNNPITSYSLHSPRFLASSMPTVIKGTSKQDLIKNSSNQTSEQDFARPPLPPIYPKNQRQNARNETSGHDGAPWRGGYRKKGQEEDETLEGSRFEPVARTSVLLASSRHRQSIPRVRTSQRSSG